MLLQFVKLELNKISTVQECDARMFNRITKNRYKKISTFSNTN